MHPSIAEITFARPTEVMAMASVSKKDKARKQRLRARRQREAAKRRSAPRAAVKVADAEAFFRKVLTTDMHAARVASLARAAVGVTVAGSLCIHAIGRGLAAAELLTDKHAIKQVDRLLSNVAIEPWKLAAVWVPYVVGKRAEVVVNFDWTEFDKDDHSMIVASLQTSHGRSTPLVWKTVRKSELKGRRNDHEDDVLGRLREVMPDGVKVTLVADRGFSDTKLYELLMGELGWDFVIRFRGVVHVEDDKGEVKKAREWAHPSGRMKVMRDVKVTAGKCPVPVVALVQDKGMKEPWCIAASDSKLTGAQIKRRYGKRFSCEETFRDIKDLRYGMGLKWSRIGRCDRRDRLMLLAVMAHALLTLLGEAGERAGLDRLLKANTSKKRTMSLFRQGLRWYELLLRMPEERLQVLMESFVEVVQEHEIWGKTYGVL